LWEFLSRGYLKKIGLNKMAYKNWGVTGHKKLPLFQWEGVETSEDCATDPLTQLIVLFRHKDEPVGFGATLLDKQKYLQSLFNDGINEVAWNKALKFIGNEIKGNGIVRKLETSDRGTLRKQEDIAEYFNEKFTQETHDLKKLQVPLVQRLDEV
jgi:hypothetical protein